MNKKELISAINEMHPDRVPPYDDTTTIQEARRVYYATLKQRNAAPELQDPPLLDEKNEIEEALKFIKVVGKHSAEIQQLKIYVIAVVILSITLFGITIFIIRKK